MAEKETADKPPETLELSDANIFLWRGCKFMDGAHETATGDRMIVKHRITGHEEDVVIIQIDRKERVKRVEHRIEFPSGRGSYSLADWDESDENRLLAIYKMFQKKP